MNHERIMAARRICSIMHSYSVRPEEGPKRQNGKTQLMLVGGGKSLVGEERWEEWLAEVRRLTPEIRFLMLTREAKSIGCTNEQLDAAKALRGLE